MAKQSLVWTTLPNGFSKDGKSLRVSLFLSPRLMPDLGDSNTLASFPDFFAISDKGEWRGDWTTTLAQSLFILHFHEPGVDGPTVEIPGDNFAGTNRLADGPSRPESRVWRALFSDNTPVSGYQFNDPSRMKVLSYPAAKVDNLVRDLYAQLAASITDQLPTAAQILQKTNWSALVTAVADNDKQFVDEDTGLRDPRKQFKAFAKTNFRGDGSLADNLGLFELFHTPPSTPIVEKPVPASGLPLPAAVGGIQAGNSHTHPQWLGYKRTELAKPQDFRDVFDFHKIVAAMGQYPTLLRKLGLVVDLLVDRDVFPFSPDTPLFVEVVLSDGAGAVQCTQTFPVTHTHYDPQHFQPVPRQKPLAGDYRVVDGLLDLNGNQFHLIQTDPDGAMLKLMNFARTVDHIQQTPEDAPDPVSKLERTMGVPAIRNAGLMLVHEQRCDMLENSMIRQKTFNDAATSTSDIDLYAEDLVRGFRVDIWDDTTKEWHSLCLREARYDLNSGQEIVDVAEEEGTVKLAATASPDEQNNKDLLWLHEAVVSWTGWSLCVRQPGRVIHHAGDDANSTLHESDGGEDTGSKDHIDNVGKAEAEVPPGLKLHSTFKTIKGSLPRLRYGRKYWMRARVVDLAGNSIEPTPHNILALRRGSFEEPTTLDHARPYLRYEPIPAPALALVKPTPDTTEAPAEGESMERMAIRTYNDIPTDATVTTEQASRFAVPARTSVREAEYHGMFDINSLVDKDAFTMIVGKDLPLSEEKLPRGSDTGYAVMQDGAAALPYLPDPLAITIAARIFGVPGSFPDEIFRIPLYADSSWPDAKPFKIELLEKPNDQPHYDDIEHTLFVPLGKAERTRLHLSVSLTPDTLKLLGVWSWLSPAQQRDLRTTALNGQHWMLTPWREIELVHAVQRPLITPSIQRLFPETGGGVVRRDLAASFALPSFEATCSIKSTDHLDLLADWNEPSDDSTQPVGANLAWSGHAFVVKLTTEQTYAGAAEYRQQPSDAADPVGSDRIRAGGKFDDRIPVKRHDFNDTRYRRIEYHLDATTRFREFMPAKLLAETVPGQPGPISTDKNIKVSGPKTRAWIPNSAPPPAPDVLYVVPTFGWTRYREAGKHTSWRRGGGLRVYLNRPWNASGYGEMLAVVLPSSNPQAKNQSFGKFVTQWGNDPIWKSSLVPGTAPRREDFPLARRMPDAAGKWLPRFAPREEADQPPKEFQTKELPLLYFPTVSIEQPAGDVAPHDVFYDEERQLWYSDIVINGTNAAYYPFIRLALARYQPVSVSRAHLSPIVLSDFTQLTPDRWVNVNYGPNPLARQVSVYGHTYSDSSSHIEAENAHPKVVKSPNGMIAGPPMPVVAASSVVEVWVERLNPTLGEDFGWQRDLDAIISPSPNQPKQRTSAADRKRLRIQRARAKLFFQQRKFDKLAAAGLIDKLDPVAPILWSGTVTLPEIPTEIVRYRIVVAEYEEYLADGAQPHDPIPTHKDRRLVFVEYMNLDQ